MTLFRIIRCALAFLLLCSAHKTEAQVAPAPPYNRIQYRSFHWQALHTPALHLYFPKGYDTLCAKLVAYYPVESRRIAKRMGGAVPTGLNIIVYPSPDAAYQTNIGSTLPLKTVLPTFVKKGKRVVVSFNGSYEALRSDLREAIARVIWEDLFDSDGIEEQVKSIAKEPKMPYWLREGGIQYFANDWRIGDEDKLRHAFNKTGYTNWEEVAMRYPALGGAAFFYFLKQQYYEEAPLQTLYQLRAKGSLPRAIRLITKKRLDSVYVQCLNFYKERFLTDTADSFIGADCIRSIDNIKSTNEVKSVDKIERTTEIKEASEIGEKDRAKRVASEEREERIPIGKGTLLQTLSSPDKKEIAYTTIRNNRRTLWIYHVQTRKRIKLYRYALPPWLSSYEADPYPLLSWKEDQLLSVVPYKGKIRLRQHSATGKSLPEQTLYGVDGVSTLDADNNKTTAKSYMLRAHRRGQGNAVLYNAQKQSYTVFKEGMTGYLHATWLDESRLLYTDTGTGQERFAITERANYSIKEDKEDKGGSSTTILGPYQPYQYFRSDRTIRFYEQEGDSLHLTTYPVDTWIEATRAAPGDTTSPWLEDYRKDAKRRAKEDSILAAARNDEPSFLDGVLSPKSSKENTKKSADSLASLERYDAKKTRPYILQLHSAYFSARVNNDYLINRYQPYLNYGGTFKFPAAGALATGGVSDLFENHHINIGYRLPAGSDGSDFFIRYGNTSRKTDWSVMWFRKVEPLQPDPKARWTAPDGRPYPGAAKVKTHYYELSLHHPLSYYASIDATTAIRKDRTIFLATERYSLRFEDISSTWSISTVSGGINKLQATLPMLSRGYRGKLLLDVFKGLSQGREVLYGISTDWSYHQPIYRYITAVGRIQAGYSVGSKKLLYNMGGVDNNLTVKQDSNTHFSQAAPYAFQTLITPLRGYRQGSIYGNSFALLNLDVYFPVFQSLIPIETSLESLNNLQLGIFTDLAWARETWQVNPQTQTKTSFGLSARTMLAGYKLRVDYAWPQRFTKPVLYFSVSY